MYKNQIKTQIIFKKICLIIQQNIIIKLHNNKKLNIFLVKRKKNNHLYKLIELKRK